MTNTMPTFPGIEPDDIAAMRQLGLSDPLIPQNLAAKYLAVSTATLARLRRSGGGPTWVTVRGAIKYRRSALEQFIEQSENRVG